MLSPGARLNKAETGGGGPQIMNGREEKDDNEGRGRNDGRRKHGEPEEICHKRFAISPRQQISAELP